MVFETIASYLLGYRGRAVRQDRPNHNLPGACTLVSVSQKQLRVVIAED